MAPTCEQYLQLWLAEIDASTPDALRAAQAARNLASCLGTSAHTRQLMQAMMDGRQDPINCETCQMRLPDFIQAQLEFDSIIGNEPSDEEVRSHLAHCPYCVAAYAEVTEWLLASHADTIAVASAYPIFDAPPVSQPLPKAVATSLQSTPNWSTEVIQQAISEGKRWIQDVVGDVYLLLAGAIQTQPEANWALKSSAPGTMLAQIVLSEEEVEGWEIEASVFADGENAALCRIEVALYSIDNPGAPLSSILVALRASETVQTRMTDEGGVVEFADIPRAGLAQATIRVTLPPS